MISAAPDACRHQSCPPPPPWSKTNNGPLISFGPKLATGPCPPPPQEPKYDDQFIIEVATEYQRLKYDPSRELECSGETESNAAPPSARDFFFELQGGDGMGSGYRARHGGGEKKGSGTAIPHG